MKGGGGSPILDTPPETDLGNDKYHEIQDSVRPKLEPTLEPDTYRIQGTSVVHTKQRLRRFNSLTTNFTARTVEKPTNFTLHSECRISLIKIIEHQPVLNVLSPRTSEGLQTQ
jgi:hypothetical protein